LEELLLNGVHLFHEADESSSSVVSNQIMHFAILYAKHMKVCAGISPEQALVAHWLWRHSEKLLLWSETISCNALNLISETSTSHIYVDGMSSPRADMSWTQCDFSSMESQNSDQCGCDKQRSRHSGSILVTELSCALACELQEGGKGFHRQWCNYSMIEIVRSLWSCQRSVQTVISTRANCSLNNVKIAQPKTKHYFKFQWAPGGCGLMASRISSGGECHGQGLSGVAARWARYGNGKSYKSRGSGWK